MRFSANTGFLFGELDFIARIRAAAMAGFGAVEFHDEAQTADADRLRDMLAETGLPVCGLNIRMGDTAGCAAIPGREDQFAADMDAAAAAAETVNAGAVHVLAGRCDQTGARDTYLRNLRRALGATDRTILIEPICRAAMPGYYLHDLDQAIAIIDEVSHPRLKIMFDCFHIEMEHGDCLARFRVAVPDIGHVQIAGVPDRGDPDCGTVDYRALLSKFRSLGYQGDIGFEYLPTRSPTQVLKQFRSVQAEH